MPVSPPIPLAGLVREPSPPPEPMSQGDQQALRLNRLESFYDGIDQIDTKLDAGTREQFQQMVGMAGNGQEARAQAVNKAYLAYTQPKAREAIETQWDYVRQQAAQSLGINKPDVTDTELYGAIGKHVQEARERRGQAHELISRVQLAALEGETDWRQAYAAFIDANKKPGAPVAHMDEFRQMAEGAAAQIASRAATIGPAVKQVSGLLAEALADVNPLMTPEKEQRQEAIVTALMPLEPADRTLAMHLAAQKAARESPTAERGGLEKAGESFTRGVQGLTLGLSNVVMDFASGGSEGQTVRADMLARNQILRELHGAYNTTVDPVKGDSAATQGLLNLSGMLPQLGLVANPWAGVPLLLASNTDARQGQLQSEGVPVSQARAIGAIQGTVDTALNFVSANMLLGKVGAVVSGPGTVSAALMKNLAKETAVMTGVTGAQMAGPLAIQEIASKLSEAVPGVDYVKELDAFKHALPETIATIVPMVLLGTGAATFRDVVRMREYTANSTMLQAAGFSPEQADRIAALGDPLERIKALQVEWTKRSEAPATQAEAIAELDATATAAKEQKGATIEKNPDGTYKVTSADGQTTLDSISDPAEAQRQADLMAERESGPAKALSNLATAISGVETGEQPATEPQAAQPLGIVSPGMGWVGTTVQRLRGIFNEMSADPKFTVFKSALNRWVGAGQLASLEIRKSVSEIMRAIPDAVSREGVTAWLQAGGDRAQLEFWAKNSTKESARKGYEAALKLTPEQIKVAQHLRDFYQRMLVTLQKHGIVDEGVENYVNQMWVQEDPLTGTDKKPAVTSGKLITQLRNAKERTFGNYFEGEEAGFKPVTKDIARLMAIYASESSKVIATRQFIKDLTTKKASDGRPLAAPFGNRALSTAKEGEPSYIKPLAKDEDTLDYRTLDNPALAKWKWIGEHNGADAFLEGQLGLHPEIYTHLKNALGSSGIRAWYRERTGPIMDTVRDAVKFIDYLGQGTKGTMLGFISPFHQVQEATHALGHRINPFSDMPALDPADPNVRRAVNHGLMLAGDNEAMSMFLDGVGGNKNWMETWMRGLGKAADMAIPGAHAGLPLEKAADWSHAYVTWLFHDYIPSLKLKTWTAMVRRNTDVFAKELSAKTISPDDIAYLSSQQANAAYGHLNYADLGRNPTTKHFWQIVLLAPDFLEARGRFAGQAFTGLVGKAGREQVIALIAMAGIQYMTSRILNKLLDDDWHTEPENLFKVVVGNRSYTMRSVPEDMFKLATQPRQFAMGRISPLIGATGFQLATGKNWRGEKVTYTDTLKEAATKWIPISLRAIPELRDLTTTDKTSPISPWEQFVGSLGIHVSRHSPIPDAYKLATEFNKAQGIKEDTGTYPVSEYQPLRYALEDGNLKKAAEELAKLRVSGKKNIAQGFHQSLFHSFTGKDQAHEHAFRAALDEEGKAIVGAADEARQHIWQNFSRVLAEQQATEPAATAPAKPKKTASIKLTRGADGRLASVSTEGDTAQSFDIERDPATGRITRLVPKQAAA